MRGEGWRVRGEGWRMRGEGWGVSARLIAGGAAECSDGGAA